MLAVATILLLYNACKKSNTPTPSKSSGCLVNSFSSGTKNASEYTGNITYNTNKTISEVKAVQTGNATIDDKYSYLGNTTTILSDIVYNNGSTQGTTSTITQNNSGQVTGIKFSTNGGSEGDIYDFTYSGQNIISATVTRFVGNNISPAGSVSYNYDSNGNLLSLYDIATGQKLISFIYDNTLPTKQGDLFWYDQVSYGENVQLFSFLYPIHNKNLCTGSPGFSPATFTYDNNKNITSISFGYTDYNYGYNCGN